MVNKRELKTSLSLLTKITNETHNDDIAPIANSVWHKHLQSNNPLWRYIDAKAFILQDKRGSAHVMAMVDKRMPTIGLVGFFGATNIYSGVKVLQQACNWLKKQYSLNDVYGPINGTITSDYRFNLADDYRIYGEPVNPTWYVDIFSKAGFKVFNRYVSGIAKYAQLYIRFVTRKKAVTGYEHITLHSFDPKYHKQNLAKYHELMNAVFPSNSIYCPVITLEERIYNVSNSGHLFDPKYCYFVYDGGKTIGFIVAYPYTGDMVIKTIGLLPEYRGKRLSDLLVRRVHEQAKKDGLKSTIYSTTRTTTNVYKKKRPGVRVFRRYITMHKTL